MYYDLCKASDGKIIVYGGGKLFGKLKNVKVTPDLAVLNLQKTPFEWTAPKVSSNLGEIPLLVTHTANLVGNYMIVAFGKYSFYIKYLTIYVLILTSNVN